ncbi:uncharacterized protein E0L32_005249 [Thyridium curvatum]|uniref:Uncharacterized protein n=1 Tax=Thyridium curvatum TaxID=1093900 RepID=A0A507B484_9PEZI|nr:uncharacterized protein E0L32_005249 [Thyridium curvatum]TPX14557.1 hypothetical protein E0L32_005249 [Thyridium curvatum]
MPLSFNNVFSSKQSKESTSDAASTKTLTDDSSSTYSFPTKDTPKQKFQTDKEKELLQAAYKNSVQMGNC